MPAPRVVVAAPLYEQERFLPQALDSLLGQSYRDFALLLVDDASRDGTAAIAERYGELDPRVSVFRNEARLGMVANWRRCFALARGLHADARYFAWASDHDVWRREWLERLVAELDAHEEAVLAYPLSIRIDEDGRQIREPWTFDTAGVASRAERIRRSIEEAYAGSMVYGLFRADALARAGVFRGVVAPDRLLLAELALVGTFRQVPDVLWERRFAGLYSTRRQRTALFADRAPWHSYLPLSWPQGAILLWQYGARGSGRPDVSRPEGARLAVGFVAGTGWWQVKRIANRLRKHRRKLAKELRRKRSGARRRLTAARREMRALRKRRASQLRRLRRRVVHRGRRAAARSGRLFARRG